MPKTVSVSVRPPPPCSVRVRPDEAALDYAYIDRPSCRFNMVPTLTAALDFALDGIALFVEAHAPWLEVLHEVVVVEVAFGPVPRFRVFVLPAGTEVARRVDAPSGHVAVASDHAFVDTRLWKLLTIDERSVEYHRARMRAKRIHLERCADYAMIVVRKTDWIVPPDNAASVEQANSELSSLRN